MQIGALSDWIEVQPGKCQINSAVADALRDEKGPAAAGSALLLNLPAISDTPRDATMARRERAETTANLRASVQGLTAPGMTSLFSLAGGQREPRTVWANLADLQRAVEQPKKANVLLVSAKYGPRGCTGLERDPEAGGDAG